MVYILMYLYPCGLLNFLFATTNGVASVHPVLLPWQDVKYTVKEKKQGQGLLGEHHFSVCPLNETHCISPCINI